MADVRYVETLTQMAENLKKFNLTHSEGKMPFLLEQPEGEYEEKPVMFAKYISCKAYTEGDMQFICNKYLESNIPKTRYGTLFKDLKIDTLLDSFSITDSVWGFEEHLNKKQAMSLIHWIYYLDGIWVTIVVRKHAGDTYVFYIDPRKNEIPTSIMETIKQIMKVKDDNYKLQQNLSVNCLGDRKEDVKKHYRSEDLSGAITVRNWDFILRNLGKLVEDFPKAKKVSKETDKITIKDFLKDENVSKKKEETTIVSFKELRDEKINVAQWITAVVCYDTPFVDLLKGAITSENKVSEFSKRGRDYKKTHKEISKLTGEYHKMYDQRNEMQAEQNNKKFEIKKLEIEQKTTMTEEIRKKEKEIADLDTKIEEKKDQMNAKQNEISSKKKIIKSFKKNTFTHEKIAELQQIGDNPKTARELAKYISVLETNPQQVENLRNLFIILSNAILEMETYERVMQLLNQIFGYDVEDLKDFFEALELPKSGGKEEDKYTECELPALKVGSPKSEAPNASTPQEGVKRIAQVIYETHFGKTPPPDPKTIEVSDEKEWEKFLAGSKRKTLLYDYYKRVNTKYDKDWKDKGNSDIRKWAREALNKTQKEKRETEFIIEALAVSQRAMVCTKGYRSRDTQMVAAMIYLLPTSDEETTLVNPGKLLEIQTGEGKTNLVAIVAVIKVLQGHRCQKQAVDVITSNPVLAVEGATDMKDYYYIFGITVGVNNYDNDNPGYQRYEFDVVYGCMSTFQFDYLKERTEGSTVKRGRGFDVVILDEVDSMLIDNGGHIAKLAEPFPGMEYLRYIYIDIWMKLQAAEEVVLKKIREEAKKDLPEEKINNYIKEEMEDYKETAAEKIKRSYELPPSLTFIPPHLSKYVIRKKEKWIDLAIFAKYKCFENRDYRLIEKSTDDSLIKDGNTVPEKELTVVPMDYRNTGVTLNQTTWSEGLHQFVQLKHNLHLTYENLTSSFVSNLGYMNKYQPENMFGMTGTLGSTVELDLLGNFFSLEFAKIPPFKTKLFKRLKDTVAEDANWDIEVVVQALEHVSVGRPVLIICESVQDVMNLESNIKFLKKQGIFDGNLRVIYAEKDCIEQAKNKLKEKEIVISTNLAGRGTNFKADKMENVGGLHVIIGFCPVNERVQNQAFGRTARKGLKGTGQMIIRKSELAELKLKSGEEITFKAILKARDHQEDLRLIAVKVYKKKEIAFKDKLFERFADVYRKNKAGAYTQEGRLMLRDFKESWAMWLDKISTDTEHDKFIDYVRLHEDDESAPFAEFLGEFNLKFPLHRYSAKNDFYNILNAHLLIHDDAARAKQILEKVINNGGNIFYAAHTGFFEVNMRVDDIAYKRIVEALKELFNIPDEEDYHGYVKESIKNLNTALDCLQKEINHIQGYDNEENFKAILISSESPFLSHIQSRGAVLQYFLEASKLVAQQLNRMTEDYPIIELKTSHYLLDHPGDVDKDIIKGFKKTEVVELDEILVSTCYLIKKTERVPKTVIVSSQANILGGLALIGISIAVPFTAIFTGSMGIYMLIDGISTLVEYIFIKDGSDEFDEGAFILDKVVNAMVQVIMIIGSAAKVAEKVAKVGIKACQKLKHVAQLAPKLGKLRDFLIKAIEEVQKFLNKILQVIKSSYKGFSLAKQLALKVGDKLADLGFNCTLQALIDKILDTIRPKVREFVKNNLVVKALAAGKLVLDLVKSKENELQTHLDDLYAAMSKIKTSILKNFNWKFKLVSKTVGFIEWVEENRKKIEKFVKVINGIIEAEKAAEDKLDNATDELIDLITNKILEIIKDILTALKKVKPRKVGAALKKSFEKQRDQLKSALSLEEVSKPKKEIKTDGIIVDPMSMLHTVLDKPVREIKHLFKDYPMEYAIWIPALTLNRDVVNKVPGANRQLQIFKEKFNELKGDIKSFSEK